MRLVSRSSLGGTRMTKEELHNLIVYGSSVINKDQEECQRLVNEYFDNVDFLDNAQLIVEVAKFLQVADDSLNDLFLLVLKNLKSKRYEFDILFSPEGVVEVGISGYPSAIGWGKFASSHEDPDERIALLKAFLKSQYDKPIPRREMN